MILPKAVVVAAVGLYLFLFIHLLPVVMALVFIALALMVVPAILPLAMLMCCNELRSPIIRALAGVICTSCEDAWKVHKGTLDYRRFMLNMYENICRCVNEELPSL